MSRIAIVTGGTRGIGKGISLTLKGKGMTVVANYAGNEKAAAHFTDETGIPAYKWDVGDHEATMEGCARVAREIGPIDVLVNNAGITRDGTLHKMTFDDWNEVMRINLGGCFNMAKATFPGMRERGWGRIVNIGSVNGQAGQYGQVNYAAAKSGIHGFTKALAQEGAKFGVTVQRHCAGLYRYGHGRGRARSGAGEDHCRHSGGAARPCGRDRAGRRVFLLGEFHFRDGLDNVDQRRPAHVLSATGRRHRK